MGSHARLELITVSVLDLAAGVDTLGSTNKPPLKLIPSPLLMPRSLAVFSATSLETCCRGLVRENDEQCMSVAQLVTENGACASNITLY